MRTATPIGATQDEMKENFQSDPLFQLGDARLVWVNEGDLANAEHRQNENAALKAENERLTKLNANLMGDDESLPRYTTKRLKHEIKEARNKALDEAMAAIGQHDKEGREWLIGSLWDKITKEAVSRIEALKGGAE